MCHGNTQWHVIAAWSWRTFPPAGALTSCAINCWISCDGACFEPEPALQEAIDQKPIQPTTRELRGSPSEWPQQLAVNDLENWPDFCSLSFSGQGCRLLRPKRKVEKTSYTWSLSNRHRRHVFLGGSLVLCLWRALIWPIFRFKEYLNFSFRSLIGVLLLYHHRVFLFNLICLLYYISRCIFWQIPC